MITAYASDPISVHDSAEKPHLLRCFNFPSHAMYDKYVLFLENFSPCISGFLGRVMLQGLCGVNSSALFAGIEGEG
jgi:hypothetical protein